MTAYHGGKQKIGLKIAKVIISNLNKDWIDKFIIGYCEPFCGMLGVYKHIYQLFEHNKLVEHDPKDHNTISYKAGDTENCVIMMWQESKKGWVPPNNVSEDLFYTLKKEQDSALKGFVGHQYSFGGQYFQGYAPKYGKTKDSSQAIERIKNISSTLQKVDFSTGEYSQYSNLKNYIIYCDPPYENTKQYYGKRRSASHGRSPALFDTRSFYIWCENMTNNNNIVFISGYNSPNIPKSFKKIWSKNIKLTGINTNKKIKDKDFVTDDTSCDTKCQVQSRPRIEVLYVCIL